MSGETSPLPVFGSKEELLELPQEKIYREALRDIRDRIQKVDDDILKLAEKECREMHVYQEKHG